MCLIRLVHFDGHLYSTILVGFHRYQMWSAVFDIPLGCWWTDDAKRMHRVFECLYSTSHWAHIVLMISRTQQQQHIARRKTKSKCLYWINTRDNTGNGILICHIHPIHRIGGYDEMLSVCKRICVLSISSKPENAKTSICSTVIWFSIFFSFTSLSFVCVCVCLCVATSLANFVRLELRFLKAVKLPAKRTNFCAKCVHVRFCMRWAYVFA